MLLVPFCSCCVFILIKKERKPYEAKHHKKYTNDEGNVFKTCVLSIQQMLLENLYSWFFKRTASFLITIYVVANL